MRNRVLCDPESETDDEVESNCSSRAVSQFTACKKDCKGTVQRTEHDTFEPVTCSVTNEEIDEKD